MKFKLTKMAAAMVLASAASTAMATPFYNNVGAGNGTAVDADTYTGLLSQWNLFADTTTVQYDTDGSGDLSVGDEFTDAGDAHIYGGQFVPGGSPSAFAQDPEGIGSNGVSQMTAHWTNIMGEILSITGDATGSNVVQQYSSGQIDFYYQSGIATYNYGSGAGFAPAGLAQLGVADNSNFTDGELVLSVDLVGGTGASRFNSGGVYEGGFFNLDFEVSFAKSGFWFFEDDSDFDTLLTELIKITSDIDANTDRIRIDAGTPCEPPPEENATSVQVDECTPILFEVASDHDGSLSFAVPLPGTVALLGIGLLGLGGMTRRKKTTV
jgi:PEP-CTERM motif-containing protein